MVLADEGALPVVYEDPWFPWISYEGFTGLLFEGSYTGLVREAGFGDTAELAGLAPAAGLEGDGSVLPFADWPLEGTFAGDAGVLGAFPEVCFA